MFRLNFFNVFQIFLMPQLIFFYKYIHVTLNFILYLQRELSIFKTLYRNGLFIFILILINLQLIIEDTIN